MYGTREKDLQVLLCPHGLPLNLILDRIITMIKKHARNPEHHSSLALRRNVTVKVNGMPVAYH